jgi:murein DD-endopeptidase MepM/ murein hydrolase activator NlpD
VNWVLIQHDDGTLAEYAHLQPNGVTVAIGQRVRRGDVLGLSGNTGFSSVPHLHFSVHTAVDGGTKRSFPFVWRSEAGNGEVPVQGTVYTAFEPAGVS